MVAHYFDVKYLNADWAVECDGFVKTVLSLMRYQRLHYKLTAKR